MTLKTKLAKKYIDYKINHGKGYKTQELKSVELVRIITEKPDGIKPPEHQNSYNTKMIKKHVKLSLIHI